MSSKVEYHKPELTSELVSRKNPSSLVFPTDPKRRKPDRSTFVAGALLACGRTKTGLFALMDCSEVPFQGAATLQVWLPFVPPDAPMPIIFSALRSMICFTVYVYGPRENVNALSRGAILHR